MKVAIFKASGPGWRPFAMVEAGPSSCVTSWYAYAAAAEPGSLRCFLLTGTTLEDAPAARMPSLAAIEAADCQEWPPQ